MANDGGRRAGRWALSIREAADDADDADDNDDDEEEEEEEEEEEAAAATATAVVDLPFAVPARPRELLREEEEEEAEASIEEGLVGEEWEEEKWNRLRSAFSEERRRRVDDEESARSID